jgi:hypothetical protein
MTWANAGGPQSGQVFKGGHVIIKIYIKIRDEPVRGKEESEIIRTEKDPFFWLPERDTAKTMSRSV